MRGLQGSKHAPSQGHRIGERTSGPERRVGDGAEAGDTDEEEGEGDLKRMGMSDRRKAGEVLEDILSNGRNLVELEAMRQVGKDKTLMSCLQVNIDVHGLLIDIRESEVDLG